MANIRNSNTFYIDTAAADAVATTTGNLASKNIRVSYITLTATAATSELILRDVTTAANKISLKLDVDNISKSFDFSETPLVFPNGINPSTVTDCTATCVVQEQGG